MTWAVRSAVLITLLLAALVSAQEYRGKVQGFVTDQSGAVVVGAKVVLVNTATGVALTTESNTTGHYFFDFVPPGNYTVTAELQGFSKTVQENIPVAVSGDVQVNLKLTVGAASQTITVQETPPALKFNSASIDTDVTEQMVQTLPNLFRNPFALVMLEPAGRLNTGPSNTGFQPPWNYWETAGMAVGGTNGGEFEMLVDGAPTKLATASGYIPNVDSVQEVVITQNSSDAELGFSAGGVVSMATKSGTNQLHGTALYMGQNPALSAYRFKYDTPNTGRKNIEDFSVGNPIRKNKLFTFNSYEKWLWTPAAASFTSTEPTDLERQGNFSRSLNKDGSLNVVYDPNTTVLNTAANTASRQPFSGNIIPASMINSASARLMQYMWAPNRTPDDLSGTNNFNTIEIRTEHYWNFMNRTDWNASDKLKIYGHFGKNRDITHDSTGGRIAEANYYEGNTTKNTNATGSGVYMLSPSTVLEVRVTYGFETQLFPDQANSYPYAQWSQKFLGSDWSKSYYDGASGLRFPLINVGGKQSFGLSLGWIEPGINWAIQPKIAIAKGKHYMKMGVDFRQQHETDGWPVAPTFGFDQANTAATFINPNLAQSGNGYASFLLGGISSGDAPYLPAFKPVDTIFGGYFQDDLKLTPRITLNLGLRVDKDTGPTEEQNRLMQYADPNGSLPALASAGIVLPDSVTQIRDQYGIPAPTWTGGAHYVTSSDPHLYHPALEFQPRLGAAIKIDEKTSLRVAYSRWAVPPILTVNPSGLPTGISWGSGNLTGYGYYADSIVQSFVAGKPTAYMDNPFPNGLLPVTGNSLGAYTQLGSSLIWNHQAYKPPLSDRFNVSLQHQLPSRIVVEATYLFHYGSNVQPQGSSGSYQTNYNIVDPRMRATLGSQLDASVANPFYNILTPTQFPGNLRNYPTVPISQLVQPYPYYTGFAEMDRPGLHNIYHSLQLKATRPLVNGVQVLAAYAYDSDRYQQFVPGTMDEFLNKPEYAPMPYPHQRFNLTTVAELPFGHGRKFANSLNRAADLLVGGWNFSALYSYWSGNPLSIGDWTMTGLPWRVPNQSGNQWFNAAAFTRKVDPYALRTTPLYISGLTGPASWNIDVSIAKQFRILERLNMEFRIDAFNATNTQLQPDPNMGLDPTDPQFGKIPGTYDPRNAARLVQYQFRLNW